MNTFRVSLWLLALLLVMRPDQGMAMTSLWQFSTGALVRGTPALIDGAVIVTSFSGSVFALDRKTGKRLWQFQARNAIAATPVVAGPHVYVSAADHFLYALQARNGRLVWRFRLDAPGLFPPSVSGQTLLVSGGHSMYALDARAGRPYWSFRASHRLSSPPRITGDMVFVSSGTDTLHALQVKDGREVWTYTDPQARRVALALENGLVLWAAADARVLALERRRGRPVWEFRGQGEVSLPPIVSSQLAIVAAGRHLVALDPATGMVVWKRPLGKPAAVDPVAYGPNLYIADSTGSVYLIRLADGHLLARFDTGRRITTAPAIDGERLIFGTADGLVHALGGLVVSPTRPAPSPPLLRRR